MIAICLLPLGAAAEPLWVGKFSPEMPTDTATAINMQPAAGSAALPAPWRLEPFKDIKPTFYRLRQWDGIFGIETLAEKSMALLARPLDVDLTRHPILCWRWRVDAVLKTADMTRKEGDDYAARVYLSFMVPPDTLGLGTRLALGLARSLRGAKVPDAAVNYVWDNRQPIGAWQANAYTDRARMLVLRSGNSDAGYWVEERRDVNADFKAAFGHMPLRISGLALAADTDNTGEAARAGFADFAFVAQDSDCPKR